MPVGEILFWLFAVITCGSAIAVAVSQNVVRMAFWLIVSLGSTALLFFLLEADFVAATQLLVYVGGTLVLLIFGVMLTASGPYVRIKASPAEMMMSAGIGSVFLALVVWTVYSADWSVAAKSRDGYNLAAQGNTGRPLGLSLLGLRPDKDLGAPNPEGVRPQLSTGYFLPFEIVSVHLLVVLVGAAYLARSKRRVAAGEQV